jgi:ubiquinone/menaquinone biosynthesis C-methylase UbiE
VTFAAPAESYDRYMGRWSRLLAPRLADFTQIGDALRVLDVGCGPGALSEELAGRVGAARLAAADPSEQFAAACAARVPGADVRTSAGERLPWEDDSFDAVLSQLVVNFMEDAPRGVAEMRRVARPGAVVAACVWDHERMEMLRTFWSAALALDPDAPTEASTMRYGTPDELSELWSAAGLSDVEIGSLEVVADYWGFEDFWEPFTAGVGPGGAYCVSLPDDARAALREECRRRLGEPGGAFSLSARAWGVRGRA